MLQPARRKYRKEQKGRNTGVATRGANVSFGDFGLKSVERGRLTARQIEAARRAISRHVKRGGRIWIRIFPDKPVSQKPAEVRMGNGKGNPEYYVAEIQPGKVLYEINGVPEAAGPRGVPARFGEAAPQDHVRDAPGRRLTTRKESVMKASELRAKDAAGLEKEVSDLLKAHFGLRMQKATQQLTNHSQLGNTRRDIARAKTIAAEKKRAKQAPARRQERRNERRCDIERRPDGAVGRVADRSRRRGRPAAEPKAKNTRTLIGKVVSDKRTKTITVLIERRTKHELYGKIVAKTSKYHAHDENGEYKMGDVVEIAESRPISKTKSWVVTRLIQKGINV